MKDKDRELKYNEKRDSMNGTIIKTLESVLKKEQWGWWLKYIIKYFIDNVIAHINILWINIALLIV